VRTAADAYLSRDTNELRLMGSIESDMFYRFSKNFCKLGQIIFDILVFVKVLVTFSINLRLLKKCVRRAIVEIRSQNGQ
jgi:hypothetical protein